MSQTNITMLPIIIGLSAIVFAILCAVAVVIILICVLKRKKDKQAPSNARVEARQSVDTPDTGDDCQDSRCAQQDEE